MKLIFTYSLRLFLVVVLFSCFGLLSLNQLQAQTLKPNTYQPNGPVNAVFNNGTNLYVGGQFTEVSKATGSAVRTNVTTGLPTSVLPAVKLGNGIGTINAMISDGGSGWYIAGEFDKVGTATRHNIAHLLSDLSVDPAFQAQVNGPVLDLALAPSGLYLAGSFTTVNGLTKPYLAQLDNTGALTAFSPKAPTSTVKKLQLVGSELFAAGDFTYLGKRGENLVSSSISDHTTGVSMPAVVGIVYASAPDGSGGYFVGGNFSQIGGVARTNLAHITSTGQVDLAFAPNPDAEVRALQLVGSNLFVGGSFTQIGGQALPNFAALSPTNGDVVPAWSGLQPSGPVNTICFANNQLWIGGTFGAIGLNNPYLAYYQISNQKAVAAPVPNGPVYTQIADGSGGYFIGGGFTQVNGQARPYLAHITAAGLLDNTFTPQLNAQVTNLILHQGRLYVGGDFNQVGAQPTTGIVALSPVTGAYQNWHGPKLAGGSLNLRNGLVAMGKRLFAIGSYKIAGHAALGLAAFNTTTTKPLTGLPSANSIVRTVISDGANGYYIGGDFTQVGGLARSYLAHILADGSVDPAFTHQANNSVYALLKVGTTLYVGGSFTEFNSQTRGAAAAINLTDNSTLAFDPGLSGTVKQLLETPSGIVMAGNYTTVSGPARQHLASFNATTAAPTTWNPNPDAEVLAVGYDGSFLYAGGSFTQFGGVARSYLARITLASNSANSWNPAPDGAVTALNVAGTAVYVAGYFNNIASGSSTILAAVQKSSATLLSGFTAPTLNNWVNAITLDGTTLHLGGDFSLVNGISQQFYVGINATTGNQLTTNEFGTDGGILSLLKDGTKMVAVGAFSHAGYQRTGAVALDVNGTYPAQVSAFRAPVDLPIFAAAANGNNLYLGGQFTTPAANLYRADTATGNLVSWGLSGLDSYVTDLVSTGSNLIAIGPFSLVNGSTPTDNAISINATTGAITNLGLTGATLNHAFVMGDTLWVAGSFTSLSSINASNLFAVKISTQALLGDLGARTPGLVYGLTKFAGRLAMSGDFARLGGDVRSNLAAFNTTTNSLTGWSADINGSVNALLYHNKRLYVGGTFNTINGNVQYGLARFNNLTSVQDVGFASFNGGDFISGVYALAAKGNRLVVGGQFTTIGGLSSSNLAIVDTVTGGPQAFSANPDQPVYALKTEGSEVVVGGQFSQIFGTARAGAALITAANTLSTTWVPEFGSAGAYTYHIGSTPTAGTVILGGNFGAAGGLNRPYLAYFGTTPALAGFAPRPDGVVNALATNGSILFAGGSFEHIGTNISPRLAGFNASTGAQTNLNRLVAGQYIFTPGLFYGSVNALAVSGGSLFVGGFGLPTDAYPSRNALIEVAIGSHTVDATFDPAPDFTVNHLSVNGSTLFAVGGFNNIGGQARTGIAALNMTNGNATSWQPGLLANQAIGSFAASGSDQWVYGSFDAAGRVSRQNAFALNLDGTTLLDWNPAPDGAVSAIAGNSSTIALGGAFTQLAGGAAANLGAVAATGTGSTLLWNGLADGPVYALVNSGTTLFAGGSFSSISGATRSNLARLSLTTGTIDGTFTPNPNGQVLGLKLDGAHLLAAGSFSTIASQARAYAARINLTTGVLDAAYDPQLGGLTRALDKFGTIYLAASNCLAEGTTGAFTCRETPNGPLYSLTTFGSAYFVGGSFSQFGTQLISNGVLINDPLGSRQLTNLAIEGSSVLASSVAATDHLVIGGNFNSVLGEDRSHLAFMSVSTTATPVIYAINPTCAAVGQTVTITGNNFLGATQVTFGGVAATTVNIVSSTEIQAVVGSGATGSVIVSRGGTNSTPFAGFTLSNLPKPTIGLSGSKDLCLGGSVQLQSAAAAGYLWSNGSTTQNITVTEPGTYTLRHISAGCTSEASDAVVVTVGRKPGFAHNLGAKLIGQYLFNQSLADGSANNQTATFTGSLLYTQIAGANYGAQVDGPAGKYVSIGYQSGRAPVNNSFAADIIFRPDLASFTGFNTIYTNDLLQVYAAATTITVALSTTTGTYYINAANANPTAVSVHLSIVVDGRSNKFRLYQDASLLAEAGFAGNLMQPYGVTYLGKDYGATPGLKGVVDQLIETNAPLQLAELSFIHDQGLQPVATSNSPVNPAQDLELTAPYFVNATYHWTGPNGFTSSLQNPIVNSVTTANAGLYELVIKDQQCAATIVSTTVVVNVLVPTITSFLPLAAAQGQTVTISGTNFTAVNAVKFGGVDATSFNVVNTTTITAVVASGASGDVSVVTAGGTATRSGFTFCNVAAPSVSASGPLTFCQGSSVTLTASGSVGGYLWSTGETTASITVTTTGNYTVQAVNGPCLSVASATSGVVVSQPPLAPVVTVNGSLPLCNGSTVTLEAPTGFSTYLWSNNATTRTITVGVAGFYSVQVAGANGCLSAASDAVDVQTSSPATPSITYSSLSACIGDTIYLEGPAGFDGYEWSGTDAAITNQRIVKVVNAAANIRVRVRTVSCWSAFSAPEAVVFYAKPAKPVITNLTGTTILCQGGVVELEAPAGYTYLWSNGSGGQSLSVTTVGKYAVRVFNQTCSSLTSDTVVITGGPTLAALTITPSGSLNICTGDSVLLTASVSAAGYEWSNGKTTQTIWAKTAGVYYVQVKSGNCLGPLSNLVTLTENPRGSDLNAPAGIDSLCVGGSITVSYPTEAEVSYLWNGVTTANQLTITAPGTYFVQQVIDGCPGNKFFFTIYQRPVRPAVLTPTITFPANNTTNIRFEDFILSWTPQSRAREFRLFIYPAADPRPATPFAVVGGQTINYQLAPGHGLPSGVAMKAEVLAWEPCSQSFSTPLFFSFGQLPDLVVSNLVYAPTQNANGSGSITYTVTNIGAGSTGSYGWHETVFINTDKIDLRNANVGNGTYKLIDIPNLRPLLPGESYTRTVTYTMPEEAAGTYYFWVMANRREAGCKGAVNADTCAADYIGDPTDGLIEVDYAKMRNNIRHGQVFVVAQPRAALQPQAVNTLPAQAFAGSTIGLRYTVKNIGAYQAYGRAYTAYAAGSTSSNIGGTVVTTQLFCESRYWTDAFFISKHPSFNTDSVVQVGVQQVHPRMLKGGLFPPTCYSSTSPPIPNPDYNNLQYIFKDSSYTIPISITLPENITGSYYLYVYANNDGSILTNPAIVPIERFGPFQVLINPYADLAVQSMTVADTLLSGQPANISYAVRNIGFAPTTLGMFDSVYFSRSATLTNSNVAFSHWHTHTPTISIGQTVNVTTSYELPDTAYGQYHVFVKVNSTKSVFEHTATANNFFKRVGTVFVKTGPMPDLALQQLFVPDSIERGAQFQVNYRMRNLGPGTARSTYQDGGTLVNVNTGVAYDLPPVAMAGSFGDLTPNQSININYNTSVPLFIPNGTYFLRLSLNNDRGINENGRYANNTNTTGALVKRVKIIEPGTTLPDPNSQYDWRLVNTAATGTIFSRRALGLNLTYQLTGLGTPVGPAWLQFELANNAGATGTLISLGGDQMPVVPVKGVNTAYTTSLTLSNEIAPGNYWLVASIINVGAIPESNLTNNRVIIPITIVATPAPDLVGTLLEAPTTAIAGRKLKVKYRIDNIGTAPTDADGPANGSATVNLIGLTNFSADQSFDQVIAAGGSRTDSLELIIPAQARGSHLLTVSPYLQLGYDLNLANNTSAAQGITIVEAPPTDLKPLSISAPTQLVPGTDTTIEVVVRNQGANPAIGLLSHYFDLRTPGQPINQYGATTERYDTLNAGQTRTYKKRYTVPGTQERNDHFVFAETNSNRQINETDYTNDTISARPIGLNYPEALAGRTTKLDGVYGNITNPWYFKISPPANTDVLIEVGLVQLTPGHIIDSVRHTTRMSIQGACASQWPMGKRELDRITDDLNKQDNIHTAIIPNATCGTYYLMASRQTFIGSSNPLGHLNVKVQYIPYSITSAAPHTVGQGPITLLVNGGRFEGNMTWVLETTGGTEVARALSSTMRNSMQGTVKFNLKDVPVGQYKLVCINSANARAVYTTNIIVQEATKDKFTVNPIAPAEIRRGRSGIYRIEVTNDGNVDGEAIQLQLFANIRHALISEIKGLSVNCLTIQSMNRPGYIEYPANQLFYDTISYIPLFIRNLRPGAKGVFEFKVTTSADYPTDFFTFQLYANHYSGWSFARHYYKQADLGFRLYQLPNGPRTDPAIKGELFKKYVIDQPNKRLFTDTILDMYYRGGILLPDDTVGHDPYDQFELGTDSASFLANLRSAFPPNTKLLAGDPAWYTDLSEALAPASLLAIGLHQQKSNCLSCGLLPSVQNNGSGFEQGCNTAQQSFTGAIGALLENGIELLSAGSANRAVIAAAARGASLTATNMVSKLTNPFGLAQLGLGVVNAVATRALENHPTTQCWARAAMGTVNSGLGILGSLVSILEGAALEVPSLGTSNVMIALGWATLAKDAGLYMPLLMTRVELCYRLGSTSDRGLQEDIRQAGERDVKNIADLEGNIFGVLVGKVFDFALDKIGVSPCTPVQSSRDPNDIVGPEGYGPKRFINNKRRYNYRIRFENDSVLASAAAQRVYIKCPIPAKALAGTLELGQVGFDNQNFSTMVGMNAFTSLLPVQGKPYTVQATAGLDIANRQVIWEFQTIDPATGQIPASAALGMLPVNDSTGAGEGYVDFSILADNLSETGDSLGYQAEIYFDDNEAIVTNRWVNIIDAVGPTVNFAPLPTLTSSPITLRPITVADDYGGSGLSSYQLWYAVGNATDFVSMPANYDATSLPAFTGTPGQTYKLAVGSQDNAGNYTEPDFDNPMVFTVTATRGIAFDGLADTVKLCQGGNLSIGWAGLNVDTAVLALVPTSGVVIRVDTILTDSTSDYRIPLSLQAGTYGLRLMAFADTTVQTTSPYPLIVYGLPETLIDTLQGSRRCTEAAGLGLKGRLAQAMTGINRKWILPSGLTVNADSVYTAETGLHRFVATNQLGCSDTAAVVVGLKVQPVAPVVAGQSVVCANTNQTYTIAELPTGTVVNWYVGSVGLTPAQTGTDTSFNQLITANTTIYARVLRPTECLSDTAVFAVQALPAPVKPIVTFTGNTTICLGDTLILSGPAGKAQYRWSNGATTQQIKVFGTGKFALEVSDNLVAPICYSPASDTVRVTVGTCVATWLGSVSTDWHDHRNWAPTRVPGPADSAFILGTAPHPVISSDVVVKSIQLGGGASVVANARLSTTIIGGTGSFTGSGAVELIGNGPGFIKGAMAFRHLTINNPAGVTLLANASYTGTLTLQAGTFNLNNRTLTAVSNPAGTAELAPLAVGTSFSNAGAFTFQRWLDPAVADANGAWVYVGSPVLNTAVNDFSVNNPFAANTYNYSRLTNSSFWFYNPTNNVYPSNLGYVKPAGAAQLLLRGQGARVWFRRSPFYTQAVSRLNLVGTPRTGDVLFEGLNYCPSLCPYNATQGGAADNGWNLVANPYPATIDWDAVGWTKTNINGATYIFRYNTGQFATYNGGVGVNGGSSLIAPGQAFFVQAIAQNPQLMASESVKSAGGVMKSAADTGRVMRLQLSLNGRVSEAIYRHHTTASRGFDPLWDAYAFNAGDSATALRLVAGQQVYSIMSLPAGLLYDTISLDVFNTVAGQAQLKLTGLAQWLPDYQVELLDRLTGLTAVVPASGVVACTFRGAQDHNRYAILLNPRVVGQRPDLMAVKFSLEPNPAKDWVRFAASIAGQWQLNLLDPLGRVVKSFAVNERSTLSLDGLARGVYFVRLPNGRIERLVVE